MTAPTRQPAPVDETGALKFDDTPKVAAPANFPRVVLQTLVEYEGATWLATFNDTSIEAASALITRRGCTILGMGAGNPTTPGVATSDGPPNCQNRNCSNYGKEMAASEHRPGTYYCKGKDPTTGNQKGYCKSATK